LGSMASACSQSANAASASLPIDPAFHWPAANPGAEDLALQCGAGQWKAGSIGKEADAAFALCEQALAIDPNNVRALMSLGQKFFRQAQSGVSGDP